MGGTPDFQKLSEQLTTLSKSVAAVANKQETYHKAVTEKFDALDAKVKKAERRAAGINLSSLTSGLSLIAVIGLLISTFSLNSSTSSRIDALSKQNGELTAQVGNYRADLTVTLGKNQTDTVGRLNNIETSCKKFDTLDKEIIEVQRNDAARAESVRGLAEQINTVAQSLLTTTQKIAARLDKAAASADAAQETQRQLASLNDAVNLLREQTTNIMACATVKKEYPKR